MPLELCGCVRTDSARPGAVGRFGCRTIVNGCPSGSTGALPASLHQKHETNCVAGISLPQGGGAKAPAAKACAILLVAGLDRAHMCDQQQQQQQQVENQRASSQHRHDCSWRHQQWQSRADWWPSVSCKPDRSWILHQSRCGHTLGHTRLQQMSMRHRPE